MKRNRVAMDENPEDVDEGEVIAQAFSTARDEYVSNCVSVFGKVDVACYRSGSSSGSMAGVTGQAVPMEGEGENLQAASILVVMGLLRKFLAQGTPRMYAKSIYSCYLSSSF